MLLQTEGRPFSGELHPASADARKRVGEPATFKVARLFDRQVLHPPHWESEETVTCLVAEAWEVRPHANPQAGDMAAGSEPVRFYLFAEYEGLILSEKFILA